MMQLGSEKPERGVRECLCKRANRREFTFKLLASNVQFFTNLTLEFIPNELD